MIFWGKRALEFGANGAPTGKLILTRGDFFGKLDSFSGF